MCSSEEFKTPPLPADQNTVNEQNYVAEFEVNDYPITDADIMERGDKAWDNMLNTINICKFNLGFGAIGLCEHAFYEAIDHAANRNVYGKYVTDFPHVKRLFMGCLCSPLWHEIVCRSRYRLHAQRPLRRIVVIFVQSMVKMKVTSR